MVHKLPGTFTVIDGLDGVGKGVVIDAIVKGLKERGARVFSLDQWWGAYSYHPDFQNLGYAYKNLESFDVLVSSEPTHAQIGMALREEVIKNNGRQYSARMTAELYAADRMILHKRVLLPALAAGKHVVQSRSVSTSLVYQSTQETLPGEEPLSMEDIMRMEGNAFCLENGPNLLIIPTINNVEEVMRRLQGREKQDDAVFESLAFQTKIKPLYESRGLLRIFQERGTAVKYIDAGISVEESRRQAVEVYRGFFQF
ncbi:hypothetical protein HZA98_00815 [Candidatus Woesearchaeota archaeon]|nr:hypothetical protein [Candidatus Woesearchaeota archaeon]